MTMTTKKVKRILVAIDLTAPSKEVIEASVALAQTLDAAIEMVHVREPLVYALADYGPSPEKEQALIHWIDRSLEEAAEVSRKARVVCHTTSLEGSPASQIVSHAEKVAADLIVVGTHGRGGIAHAVLGSVAERVVQKAGRMVLVVPTGRSAH
jgi:nucleotide-binding universal stress UspA family protein